MIGASYTTATIHDEDHTPKERRKICIVGGVSSSQISRLIRNALSGEYMVEEAPDQFDIVSFDVSRIVTKGPNLVNKGPRRRGQKRHQWSR